MPPFDAARLPEAADPAQAALGVERWRARAAEADDDAVRSAALRLAEDPSGARLLRALFGNSPHLGACALKEQAFLLRLLDDGFDGPIGAEIAAAAAHGPPDEPTDAAMRALRLAKRRVALGVALADVADAWPLERVTGALSALAEAALDRAAGHALRRAAATGDLEPPDPDDPCRGSGLIVLGMGKLGARELNYSSDVDVIVLYDEDVVRSRRREHLARTFIRLARDLVRMMEERTAEGYVFRTDLRLRPDPAATPLAVPVAAAETYYGSVGQNWERAAMIKARPVAGDRRAGRAFVEGLRGFVWRRHLDFAAIQDIHSIKRQINAHRGHRVVAVNGHDVKVGRGGIREVEFYAQTLQLIYGGRDPGLRVAPTLDALRALAAAGRADPAATAELSACYRELRRIEHRIQMVDDRQTHSLPADDAGVDALAVFMGEEPAAFRARLRDVLERVEDRYAALFEEAPALSGPGNLVFTGADDDPETIATLRGMGYANPAAVAAAVRGWHHGRYRATRSTRARELLTELVPTLLERLGRTAHPDQAFASFDRMLSGLPAGVPLFSLFHANPSLLDLVADVLGTAPRFADALARRPTLLDPLIESGPFGPLPGRAELQAELGRQLAVALSYEEVLDVVRRFAVEQQFRAAVQMLAGRLDGDAAGPFLSDVAEAALGALLPRTEDEFARRHGRCPGGAIALVALGKLGERRMSIGSDLDLIAVYDVPDAGAPSDGPKPLYPSEYYIRLTQRLVTAITALTAEGRLYEADLRLRPSGNKGPLAVSLAGFREYQDKEAWTWEHQALTRARPVAGPDALRERIGAEISSVLRRPRDPQKLLRDVADMRRRIDAEHGTSDPWNAKYRRGGLIDAEFAAQYLVLRHAAEHPGIARGETVACLEAAEAAGLVPPAVARPLAEAVRTWRRVQAFARLAVEGRFDPATAPAGVRDGMARAALGAAAADGGSVDFEAASTNIDAVAHAAHEAYRALIDAPAAALPGGTGDEASPTGESTRP
jgi:glutamate-ammonia-ligase adenylyltransferase